MAEGIGVRALGSPDVVDADTLYRIASNTKPLTTLMVARLVDEERLDWDLPVVSIASQFRIGDRSLTPEVKLRHLACACAGFPYRNLDWEFASPNASASDVFRVLADMPILSKLGGEYRYSNPPATALGYIAGKAAYPDLEWGIAYDRAMSSRVFEPLGMTRTSFTASDSKERNIAKSHGIALDGTMMIVDDRRDAQIHAVRPSGGAFSSVNDLLAYVRLELSEGRLADGTALLSSKAMRARWSPQVATGPHSTYGLGLETDHSMGTPMLFHGGRLYGQRSNIFWWPEHGIGGVILANSSTGDALMHAVPRKLGELLFDLPDEAEKLIDSAAEQQSMRTMSLRAKWSMPAEPSHVSQIADHYRSPELGTLQIERLSDQTIFRFAAWEMSVASRRGDDGELSFLGTIPSPPPAFVAGSSAIGKTLTIRAGTQAFVFTEVR